MDEPGRTSTHRGLLVTVALVFVGLALMIGGRAIAHETVSLVISSLGLACVIVAALVRFRAHRPSVGGDQA